MPLLDGTREISTATFEEKDEPDQNAYEEARELVYSMGKRLTTCDKRKVAPPRSAPNELWARLLLQNLRVVPNKTVGACQKTLETTHFQEFLARTPAQTISTRQPRSSHTDAAQWTSPNQMENSISLDHGLLDLVQFVGKRPES